MFDWRKFVIKTFAICVGVLGVVCSTLATAQTGNPVQDAINRDAMNKAIIRQATGHAYQPQRTIPAGARALFGHWVSMRETNQTPTIGSGNCALSEIEFTETTEARTTPASKFWAAERTVHKVSYLTRDAHSFYAVPETATVGPYVAIVDSQHIRLEYADQCLYRKVG
jgi:hypothetical protein